MDTAKLKEALIAAQKNRDQVRVNTIRGILSEIQYGEIQKSTSLTQEEIIGLLQREVKKRKEEIEFAEKAGRTEAREQSLAEISIIESFLPQQFTAEKLEDILTQLKAENSSLTMGDAMKVLKEKYAGQYDGKEASVVAKRILG